ESEARHQASLWIVESLFLDYMAMIEYCHGQLEDFTQHRLIPDLASICLQHLTVAMSENPSPEELELQTSLRHEFSDWTWSYIVHPRITVEPQLMRAICRRVKVMMFETVDSLEYEEVKRTDLVKKLVLQSV